MECYIVNKYAALPRLIMSLIVEEIALSVRRELAIILGVLQKPCASAKPQMLKPQTRENKAIAQFRHFYRPSAVRECHDIEFPPYIIAGRKVKL